MKFLSQINVNSNYALPTVDGNTGQVLTTDGQGNTYWGTISLSSASLNSLSDVNITNPSSGQVLTYGLQPGESVAAWYNKTPNYLTPASSISTLSDVSVTTAVVGNLLRWNGSNWVNWAPNFLTSYDESDPVFSVSAAATITSDDIASWNTAYGWGNHAGLYANLVHTHSVFTQATSGVVNGEEVTVPGENGFVPASGLDDGTKFLRGDGTWQVVTTDLTGYATETWVGQQGYLTSFTETDPVFAASEAYNIRTQDVTAWNTAYGWGDHNEAGYLTSYTETDPIYTASSWYTTTNNSTNWNTAYGWGNHAGLYVTRVFEHTQGWHSYAYPDPEAWYTIAKVVLNGNCQSQNLFGEYRDLSYYLNTAYKIHITARAECDFLSNNESHTIRVNIVTTSTNKTGFGDKVRVVLTRQEDGVREYELQYYRTTWDTGRWELQRYGGWIIYDTSQTAGTEIPSEHIVYNSNVIASNFYGDNVYINGYAAATQSWVGSQGYITSYTETDPIYTASSWYTTTNNASNWDTAYGWGNHALAGYLTAETDSQTLEWNQGEKLLTISNGNSVDLSQMASVQDVEAYGFITGENDTLHTVVSRGSLTSNTISVEQTVGGGFVYRTDTNWGGWARNGFSFANGSGTVFKGIGAYGDNGNSLSYIYVGNSYSDNSIRIYGSSVVVGNTNSGAYVADSALHVAGSGLGQLSFEDVGVATAAIALKSSAMYFGHQSSSVDYVFKHSNTYNGNYATTGTAFAVISSSGNSFINSGNVGIGTASPSQLLELQRDGKIGFGANGDYGTRVGYFDDTGGVHGFHVDTKHGGTWTNRRFVVRADSGNVGIGTTSPQRALNIVSNNAQIRISDSTAPSTNYWEFGSLYYNTNQDLFISNQVGTALTINSSGNIGIGTYPNQGVKLQVAGTVDVWSSTNTLLRLNHDGTRGVIETYTGGGYSNTVINPSGGNVGIGTTSPNYKLDVDGNIHTQSIVIGRDTTYGDPYRVVSFGYPGNGTNRIFAANGTGDGMYFAAASGHGFNFRPNGGTDNLVTIGTDGTINLPQHLKATNGNLSFSAGGNQIMNIDLNGKVYPQSNNANDLGFSSSLAWRNIYAHTLFANTAIRSGTNNINDTYGASVFGAWTADGKYLTRNWHHADGGTTWDGLDYITGLSDAPVGSTVIRSNGAWQGVRQRGWTPIDRTKTYKISVWFRAISGNPYCYASLTQAEYNLNQPNNGGWGNPYFWAGVPPTDWTEYTMTIGPAGSGAQYTWNATTRYAQVGVLLNYLYEGYEGQAEFSSFKIEELDNTLAANTSVLGGLTVNGDFSSTSASVGGEAVATRPWVSAQGYAVQQDIAEAVSNLVNSSPEALDTLGELANALGNDANFATTVTNSLAGKVSKSGDTMTGNLTTTGLTVGNGVATGRQPYGPLANANIVLTSSASDSSGVCGIEFTSGNNYPSDGATIYFENNASGGGSERAKLTLRVDNDQEDFIELRAGKVVINANTYSGGGQNPAVVFQHNDTQIASITSGGQIDASGGNSSQWNTAYGWGNHAGLYIPINPDADGPAWSYSDENPTINGVGIGGTQQFGADGNSLTGGALQARMLNAYDGSVNSAYGYHVGNLHFGNDSGVHDTTQVINSAGTFVGPEVSTGKIYGTKLLMGSGGTDENYVGNGGIRIGRTDTNYTHGSGWSGTSSTMFIDCSDVATITIHDSGHRLVEYMTYDGAGTNTIFTGRDIGWGTTNWSFGADVEIKGTFTETSSIRYKENIVDLEPATEKVEQLRPVRYNKIGSEVEEIGLIAEEVAEIYPEVVTYNEEGQPDGINYTRLSAVLIKTVQELTQRINKLESK